MIVPQILGVPDVAYVSTETPMLIYLNTHIALEHLRSAAQQSDGFGPKASRVNSHVTLV